MKCIILSKRIINLVDLAYPSFCYRVRFFHTINTIIKGLKFDFFEKKHYTKSLYLDILIFMKIYIDKQYITPDIIEQVDPEMQSKLKGIFFTEENTVLVSISSSAGVTSNVTVAYEN